MRLLLSCLLSLTLLTSQAALQIELTQGNDSSIPVALLPFLGDSDSTAVTNLSDVIKQDLQNSGQFNLLDTNGLMQQPHAASAVDMGFWKSQSVDDVIVGTVTKVGWQYKVSVALVNLYSSNNANPSANLQTGVLFDQDYVVSGKALRALAHHIADDIYFRLTGVRGIFSTRLAYVVVKPAYRGNTYRLEISDYDGYNPQTVLYSSQPIMSPAWSPDGKKLAYVSFEHGKTAIYVDNLATGQRSIIAEYDGVNGAPAWSPDGKKLALVLSSANGLDIFVKNLQSGGMQRLTQGWSINTEPNWSPDGASIYFTSDRGGSPQIYNVDIANGKTQRITFEGKYNARPSISADGQKLITLYHDSAGEYGIGVFDLTAGTMQVFSGSSFTQSPSLAPNGKMVIYSKRDDNGKFLLSMVSTDGKVQLDLPMSDGNVREPAWSPFLG